MAMSVTLQTPCKTALFRIDGARAEERSRCRDEAAILGQTAIIGRPMGDDGTGRPSQGRHHRIKILEIAVLQVQADLRLIGARELRCDVDIQRGGAALARFVWRDADLPSRSLSISSQPQLQGNGRPTLHDSGKRDRKPYVAMGETVTAQAPRFFDASCHRIGSHIAACEGIGNRPIECSELH